MDLDGAEEVFPRARAFAGEEAVDEIVVHDLPGVGDLGAGPVTHGEGLVGDRGACLSAGGVEIGDVLDLRKKKRN